MWGDINDPNSKRPHHTLAYRTELDRPNNLDALQLCM
uniref:Uncharacterized protein n=1 Tax=Anguilla anguilla TaxID=7936 RepID=A0A0E9XLT2_ANGAN